MTAPVRCCITVSIVCVACMAVSSLARATPSTLVWIPSADVQAPGTLHFGLDDYFGRHGGEVPADFGLTVGLKNAEVGVDVFTYSQDAYLNAKVLLAPETGRRPQLAVGVYGVGLNSSAGDFNMVYLIGAKTFRWVRVHLGALRGSRSAIGPDNVMILAGIERELSERWWAAIDYQSGDSAFGALSVGVAYGVGRGLRVLAGWDWFNAPGSEDTLTAQLDWQWRY